MSEIAKKISQVIQLDLAPFLKLLGYKKNRNNFYLVTPDSTFVIEIQSSQWNRGNEGEFTINLGRNFPEVEKIQYAKVPDHLPKAGQCTINTRIGQVMPQPRDHWWKVDGYTDTNDLSKEVRQAVEIYGLKWLNKISTLQELKKEVGDWPWFTAASVSLLLNQHDDVYRHLNELIESKPQAVEWVREWIARNKVNISNPSFKGDWLKPAP